MRSVRHGLALAVFFASLLPMSARGHGDDGHAVSPGPLVGPRSTQAAGGLGDLYEVLVKYPPGPAGPPAMLRVFVADGASNEAVPGAEVTLTLTGAKVFKTVARPSDTLGIYQAEVRFPADGDYAAVASVTRGEHIDLVTLGTIHVGPVGPVAVDEGAGAAITTSGPLGSGAGAIAALALLTLCGVAFGVRWERRRAARVRHA
jgi:hypothetical protein